MGIYRVCVIGSCIERGKGCISTPSFNASRAYRITHPNPSREGKTSRIKKKSGMCSWLPSERDIGSVLRHLLNILVNLNIHCMRRKIIPYDLKLKEFARKLRNDSTLGEILLWNELKSKKLYGYDFHRQKPLLKYIVDFYCYKLDLVIEIDGHYHTHEEKYNDDVLRDEELKKYDLTVIRFTEQEVRKDMNNVLRTIETYISQHKNTSIKG
jgi:very-short-patch-repair endonuclease